MKKLLIFSALAILIFAGCSKKQSIYDISVKDIDGKEVSMSQYKGKVLLIVNVMRNMSVSCDCEGVYAAPVVTPNVGILSSTDILAIDQACVDIIYAMMEEEHHDMVERIESRHGLRQLSYMKELGMGHDRYVLIDLDNGGRQITAAEAAKDLKPFVKE